MGWFPPTGNLTGEILKVVWVELSTLSLVVFGLSATAWDS
jgi:hypothetical protein